MKNRLTELLDTYEDFELAFLWRYKLRTYLDETQAAIEAYIRQERRLSVADLERLIADHGSGSFEDEAERCPRCKTKKIITTKETFWNTGGQPGFEDEAAALDGFAGRSTAVHKLVCAVCDYVIQDLNNNIGPWERFKRLITGMLFRKA